MPSLKSIIAGFVFTSLASGKWIAPGGRWKDTDGNTINAHAGSVTWDHVTGRYFWFGEYKTEEQEEGGGVRVYSSDDLGTWTNHGLALGMDCTLSVRLYSQLSQTNSSRRRPSLYLARHDHSKTEGDILGD
jgi:hypothetical protein